MSSVTKLYWAGTQDSGGDLFATTSPDEARRLASIYLCGCEDDCREDDAWISFDVSSRVRGGVIHLSDKPPSPPPYLWWLATESTGGFVVADSESEAKEALPPPFDVSEWESIRRIEEVDGWFVIASKGTYASREVALHSGRVVADENKVLLDMLGDE